MMISPFFSIIIPTFNRAHIIKHTINSILKQDFKNFEIIVVDDGSTDNTEQVMRELKDERIKYVRKENGERAAARNAGAQIAAGKFVNFVDSDDILYPHHLQLAFQFIESHDPELFHLGYDVKTSNNELLYSCPEISNINKQIIFGNFLSCNGVFIKREIILENPFNEDRALSALEDWELWIRLSSKYKFFHLNNITSTVVNHEGRSVVTMNGEKIKQKVERFIRHVSSADSNILTFGSKIKYAIASANTYAALHLSMARASKSDIIKFLIKGILGDPRQIFKKRFLVILRNFFKTK